MYALVGIALVSMVFYLLSSLVTLHSQQSSQELNTTQTRMILHSLLDYSVEAIKQNLCLSDTMLPEKPCKVDHPRSIGRLLMNADSQRIIKTLFPPGGTMTLPNPIQLSQISSVIDLSEIRADHPLSTILKPLEAFADVRQVSITMKRDDRPHLATTGREVFIHIDVELRDSGGGVVKWIGTPLRASADLGVFPREIGTFALVVANDLHMEGASAPAGRGDARIQQFAGSPAGYAGLIFESPVFVNGNIVLPQGPSAPGSPSGRYAPVTFADKVYIGNGAVYRGTNGFTPLTAGRTDDQLWTDVTEFGGFQKGIEIDGQRDVGLDVLAGIQAGTNVNLASGSLQLCLDLLQAKSDLAATGSSQLGALLKDAQGNLNNGVTYRLGFNDANAFRPQTFPNLGITGIDAHGWKISPAPFSFPPANSSAAGTILQASISLGNDAIPPSVSANLGYSSGFGLQYQPTPSPRIPGLQSQVKNLQAMIAKGADPNGGSPTQADIDNAQAQLDAAQADLDKLLKIAAQVVQITVEAKPVIISDIQPVFVDLLVKATPLASLTDGEGNPIPFQIQVSAYDISCDLGNCRDNFLSKLIGGGGPGKGNGQGNAGGGNKAMTSNYNRKGYLTFAGTSLAAGLSNNRTGLGQLRSTIANETVDYAALQKSCTYGGGGSAFGGIDWGISFKDTARFSWSFTNKSGLTPGSSVELILNNLNSTPPNTSFQVQSIANLCRIQSSATFVAGFFTCDMLRIEPRTTPLTIVGTFIVSGLEIDPSAYRAGIRWRSIYHPQSATDLRTANILRPLAGMSCNPNLNVPFWHPYPSLAEAANTHKCNVESLRALAEPFTWTSVDPDCGLPSPTAARTVCKNQLVHFQVFELFREIDL